MTHLGTALNGDSEHDTPDLHSVWGNGRPQTPPPPSSFSSAVRRNETTPAKRRHGSDAAARRPRSDHDPWAGEGPSHVRAHTLDSDNAAGPSWLGRKDVDKHPLRAPSIASSSSVTLEHNTRPTMRRMLSLNDPPDGTPDGNWLTGDAAGHDRSRSDDKEMLVIVHEVQPTDSLAGVALKYGISLAELRRANQLWASDTIHLRNTLYIPVDKARHVRHLKTALLDSDTQHTHPDTSSSGPGPPSESGRTPCQTAEYTLRKVPASQLSFFPPPTHPPSPPRSGGLTPGSSQTLPSRKPPSSRAPLPPGFARAQDAPLQNIFEAFSTSLHTTANHLRALTQSQSALFAVRPTTSLASRLSLESNSATASSASEDLEWKHEMDDIGPTSGPRGPARARRESRPGATATLRSRRLRSSSPDADERGSVELDSAPFASSPPSKHRRNSSSRSTTHPSRPNGVTNDHGTRVVPYAVDDAGAADWEPHAKGGVRTAQLEPSPSMQLPTLQRRRPKSEQP